MYIAELLMDPPWIKDLLFIRKARHPSDFAPRLLNQRCHCGAYLAVTARNVYFTNIVCIVCYG